MEKRMVDKTVAEVLEISPFMICPKWLRKVITLALKKGIEEGYLRAENLRSFLKDYKLVIVPEKYRDACQGTAQQIFREIEKLEADSPQDDKDIVISYLDWQTLKKKFLRESGSPEPQGQGTETSSTDLSCESTSAPKNMKNNIRASKQYFRGMNKLNKKETQKNIKLLKRALGSDKE